MTSPSTNSTRAYLSDGVYVEFDGWQLTLIVPAEASESRQEQRIYMNPTTWSELMRYARDKELLR